MHLRSWLALSPAAQIDLTITIFPATTRQRQISQDYSTIGCLFSTGSGEDHLTWPSTQMTTWRSLRMGNLEITPEFRLRFRLLLKLDLAPTPWTSSLDPPNGEPVISADDDDPDDITGSILKMIRFLASLYPRGSP
ncbi:hypothetical protein E4U22_003477 [Claviceps purpurea]|nr:hypothetical protein E4U38_004994 [Claviceps purpurea]KAG6146300.1 hypothetical protein E4U37_000444 [Claviceps purpurea]KAG6164500.1 hypothetical protein E4U11_001138 [Claviceps purpurea]KAG6174843.1 hypothetical protein E4U27_006395 [Claviceps purpurea]KAG6182506.1 hypothetical protein E4U10_007008 [Claviceps purpurea]